MPFCELWRAEHAGVSVFAVLEVSRVSRRALLFRYGWAFVGSWGDVRVVAL